MLFHYLTRGVIFKDGKVLLAQQKGADHTFLPGGHIGMGERAEAAMVREIFEELEEKAIVKRFIGAVEALWTEEGEQNHELNLVFEVEIPNLVTSEPPRSREAHLEFMWVGLAELNALNLLPIPMRECISKYARGYAGFWGSVVESA
jgi:8-oxo-dGTP diphosphatase